MKQYRTAAAGYALLFFLELAAAIWMASGFSVSGKSSVLASGSFAMLKYFTVDSNLLMGIVAAVLAVLNLQVLRGRRTELPRACYFWNLSAVTGVSLTMLVTVFFLAPSFGQRWKELFQNSNFLLHLINPLVSIALFISREKLRVKCLPGTLAGLIPVTLYGTAYFLNVMLHLENGTVQKSADWYGFVLTGSVKLIPAVMTVMLLVTWLISLGLWALQQRCAGKKR